MSRLTRAIDGLAARPEPFVTYYDLDSGERTELSGVTTANWVAKTASMLSDGFDIEAGARLRVDLPTHWQSLVWLLAAWRLGLVVSDEPGELAIVGPQAAGSEELIFASSLRPMGLRFAEPPAGAIDYTAEVLSYPDLFVAPDEPDEGDPALAIGGVLRNHGDLGASPAEAGRVLLRPGALDRDARAAARAVMTGSSIVIAARADASALQRIAAEENAVPAP